MLVVCSSAVSRFVHMYLPRSVIGRFSFVVFLFQPEQCMLYLIVTGVQTFFFFQAEDGIRDLIVTGVQTCALPISYAVSPPPPRTAGHCTSTTTRNAAPPIPSATLTCSSCTTTSASGTPSVTTTRRVKSETSTPGASQIGRASCRERV